MCDKNYKGENRKVLINQNCCKKVKKLLFKEGVEGAGVVTLKILNFIPNGSKINN